MCGGGCASGGGECKEQHTLSMSISLYMTLCEMMVTPLFLASVCTVLLTLTLNAKRYPVSACGRHGEGNSKGMGFSWGGNICGFRG